MNIPLKNIEVYLDEQSLLRGEILLENEAVQSLTEVENHLWVANVKDNQDYEVEVKISPSRLLAATCECERYLDIGMCEHVSATLLLLRKKQLQKKQKRQSRRKTNKKPTKLTTGAVLESISHEELVSFARQYAKTNRNFALALKARFAPQVSMEESKEKYLQLLDSTISMARKSDRTISFRGSQKIYKVLIEIQSQIEEAIARKHYRESFHIIQSIIEKITPILKKIERNQEEIIDQLNFSFQSLKKIVELHPAPALQAEIWEYCLKESSKLRYRNNQLDNRFFIIMFSLADEKRKKEQLTIKLSEHLTKYEYEGRSPAQLLLLLLQVLESLKQKDKAKLLMDRYLTEPTILRHAIRQSVKKKDIPKAKILAINGLKNKLPRSIKTELEETLLHIAETEKDKKSIIKFSTKRLLHNFDISYLTKLRSAAGSEWPHYQKEVLGQLRQQAFSMDREVLIGRILKEDQNWKALLAHLEQGRSLELLRQFDELLLPAYKKEIYQMYRQFLAEYLNNHLGRKPSTRIRLMLQHLYDIKADDLVGELVEQFRRTYPERHTLMEELEVF